MNEEQRTELVGKYSEHYDRPFTEEDLTPKTEYSTANTDISNSDDYVTGSGQHQGVEAEEETDVYQESSELAGADIDTDAEKFLDSIGYDDLSNAASMASEAASSVLESTLVTAFAMRKLYKVSKRRKSIENAYKIRLAREKEIFKQLTKTEQKKLTDDPKLSEHSKEPSLEYLLGKNNQLLTVEEKESFTLTLLKSVGIENIPNKENEINDKLLKEMGIKYSKVDNKNRPESQAYKLTMDTDKLYRYLKKHSSDFSNIFASVDGEQTVTKAQFKQYADLCFIEEETSGDKEDDDAIESDDTSLKKILKIKDCYVESSELHGFLEDILVITSPDEKRSEVMIVEPPYLPLTVDERKVLQRFKNDIEDNQMDIGDKEKVKKVNKILDKIGVHIDYKTDKILGSIRKSSKAVLHKIEVNTDKLYPHLKKMGELPYIKEVDDVLSKNDKNIDALYTLRDYDKWKINHHQTDFELKFASSLLGAAPTLFSVDEILKSVAYGKESNYRQKNKKRMNDRIDSTIKTIHKGDKQETIEDKADKLIEMTLSESAPKSVQKMITKMNESLESKGKFDLVGALRSLPKESLSSNQTVVHSKSDEKKSESVNDKSEEFLDNAFNQLDGVLTEYMDLETGSNKEEIATSLNELRKLKDMSIKKTDVNKDGDKLSSEELVEKFNLILKPFNVSFSQGEFKIDSDFFEKESENHSQANSRIHDYNESYIHDKDWTKNELDELFSVIK